MWILQEYKFFLIIAIIALVAIIALFFNTQKSQEYVDYTTNLQASFAQIKGVASDTKTLKSVITVDGTNIKGLKNNSLFGLSLQGTAANQLLIDNLVTTVPADVDTAVAFTPGTSPAPGKYKISFATTSDGDTTDNLTNMTETKISALNTASGSILSGWDMDTNGYLLYTFEDAATAKNIIDKYIPEWTLIGTSTVKVKFIR